MTDRLTILREKIMENFDEVTPSEIDEYLLLAEKHRGKEMQKDIDIINVKLLARVWKKGEKP